MSQAFNNKDRLGCQNLIMARCRIANDRMIGNDEDDSSSWDRGPFESCNARELSQRQDLLQTLGDTANSDNPQMDMLYLLCAAGRVPVPRNDRLAISFGHS